MSSFYPNINCHQIHFEQSGLFKLDLKKTDFSEIKLFYKKGPIFFILTIYFISKNESKLKYSSKAIT